MFKKILIGLLLILGFVQKSTGQPANKLATNKLNNATKVERPSWVSMHLGTGYQINWGDWRERYHFNTNFDMGAEYQYKEKWLLGFNYTPYSSSAVSTDSIYGKMVGPSSFLFDKNGNPAVIRTYMRGFNMAAVAGKMFTLKEGNNRKPATWSMIVIGGIGYYEHYTKFQLDKGLLPQLESEYMYGHDNYRGGITVNEQLRLQFLNPQTLCFTAGLSFMQGFSTPRREWDMGVNRAPDAHQTDFGISLNAGLIIPINIYNSNIVREADYFE